MPLGRKLSSELGMIAVDGGATANTVDSSTIAQWVVAAFRPRGSPAARRRRLQKRMDSLEVHLASLGRARRSRSRSLTAHWDHRQQGKA
jgi:hypothetical protein